MRWMWLLLLVIVPIVSAESPTTRPTDLRQELHNQVTGNQVWGFPQAKRLIYNDIDRNDNDTVTCIYGGGPVGLGGPKGQQKPIAASGMSIEHAWPRKADWGDGVGVKTDAESDLHLLFPARRGLNTARSNHPYGVPTKDIERLKVSPNGEIARGVALGEETGSRVGKDDAGREVFEPPAASRGDLARAMFYVSIRYEKPIPDEMEKTLREWSKADPPDDAERARDKRIEDLQGNSNVFVGHPEMVEKITDF